MENITINKLELASELADRELHKYAGSLNEYDYDHQFPNGITIDVDDNEVIYTEEAQDEFNELYDKYLSLIESCKA